MSPIIGSFSGSRSFGRGGGSFTAITATGGSISQVDGYRIHTFTSGTSTFSVTAAPPNATIEVFVVGGGGPGGNGLAGAGGGGGVIHNLEYSISPGNYNVVVGAQSPQSGDRSSMTGSASNRGYDSTFSNLTALGGGHGGWWDGVTGFPGGCGGGAGGGTSSNNRAQLAGGAGTAGQGYNGGNGIRYPANNGNNHWGGGGGGAGGPGRAVPDYEGYGADGAMDGGVGYLCSIDGTARYWAGGGGGSVWISAWAGRGGLGGGGGGNHANNTQNGTGGGGALNTGSNGSTNGGNGGTNTGGGGGGSSGNSWNRGPGGAGGSGIVIVRYPYLATATGVAPGQNLGLTEATAAESAVAIKRAWASAPDRAYWIKPTGQSQAYKVHCLMSIEGGGWEFAWRNNSVEFGPFASGSFLVSNWAGWAWNTKSQVDSIGNYEKWGDANAFAPTYYARDFTDCMIISNSRPSSRKIGVRFNPGRTSLLACINQPDEIRASSLLFGTYNMQTSLLMRPDSTVSYGGGTYFAFKSGSDDHPAYGDFTGGHNAAGWTRYQVGCGRDNQSSSFFGGGFGAAAWNNAYHRMSGHFWGHGDGRNGSVWSGDRSSMFEGHAFYVRKEAP